MPLLSCAIIGHKPTRFKFKYKEDYSLCKKLKKKMREQFCQLYESGIRKFYVGSALGIDLWAAEILLSLTSEPGYPDLQLFILLPFDGHSTKWDNKSRKRLTYIKRYCTGQHTLSQNNTPDLYKKCGYYLIEQADIVFAVYNNDRTVHTTIGQTVNYARSKYLPIIFLHPDTAEIATH